MSIQSAASKKTELRQWYREQRSALSSQTRDKAAIEIATRLVALPEYQRARHIGVYHAMREEISLSPFIDLARQDNKSLYLPVVSGQEQKKQLHFWIWREQAELTFNRHGIAQPAIQISPDSEPELDLVLLPLVAFDNKGHRLGMGGGYYDRYFAKPNNTSDTSTSKTPVTNVFRIGIAHSCQQAHQIPHEDWDIGLHAVVTEKEFINF